MVTKRIKLIILLIIALLGFGIMCYIFVKETYSLAGNLALITFVLGGFCFRIFEILLNEIKTGKLLKKEKQKNG